MPTTTDTRTTVQRTALLQAINQVLPAVRAGNLPILGCVHLHHHDGTMTVTATDLDLRVSCTVAAEGRGLEVAVGARLLRKLLHEAAGPLALSATDDELDIRWARTDAQLRTIPLEDWPRPIRLDGDPIKLSAGDVDVIRRVARFASTDDARPILTSIRLGGTEVVATDSYRLAIGELSVDVGTPVLLPGRVARFLPANLLATEHAELTVDAGTKDAQIKVGELIIRTRLVDGDFPPYERLIPKTTPHQVTVNRTALIGAVRTAAALAGDATPVRLIPVTGAHDSLEVVVVQQDVGQVHTLVDATWDGAGPAVTAAFNPRYLLELLGTLDADQVTVEIVDALKPVVVREEPYTLLLMPVRVS